MIFNSVTFLAFLCVVLLLYWTLPRRARLWMLFIASLTFYGFWRWEYLPVMLGSAVTDYLVSLRIAATENRKRRRRLLLISLVVNLGLLFYFKYLQFTVDNVWVGLRALGVVTPPPILDIILPLGISFYTFQTISYTVDVYRKQTEPLREFVLYGCFVTFFPQLVAGPVLRLAEVTPQLDRRPKFTQTAFAGGLRRVLMGLFLKVVVADNLSPFVDAGFEQDVATLGAIDVWTLAFMFGFQIYCDFSAYSHIALGCAKMMGIEFPENFNFPYAASSPKDFWGRWHISLSSWIRDYLYLPLSGARFNVGKTGSTGGLQDAVTEKRSDTRTRALFLTWAIMGLWHGANWTFVFWGVYHAVCVFVFRATKGARVRLGPRLRRWGGWAITLPIMMLSWIPFRARDLGHTFALYAKLFQPGGYVRLGMRENIYLIAALMMMAFGATYFASTQVVPRLRRSPALFYTVETATMVIVIGLAFIFLRPIQQFIYFQF